MRRTAGGFALVALLASSPLAAQHDSALVLAVRRATEGLGDSARGMVRARLRTLSPTDSLYAEALFTAGVVASSADSAAFYFRRVAFDLPPSNWADDALLRLGQLGFAAGDWSGAGRSFDRIISDYPSSDVRPQALYWSGRVRLESGDAAGACQRLSEARDAAATDIELSNQIAFYLQRCATMPAATPTPAVTRRDSIRPDTGARGHAAPPTGSFYAVQVAAVRTAAQADEVMRTLKAQGYTARVSRDTDGMLKVRVGRFPTKPEAERLSRELKRKMGGAPFVVDEQ